MGLGAGWSRNCQGSFLQVRTDRAFVQDLCTAVCAHPALAAKGKLLRLLEVPSTWNLLGTVSPWLCKELLTASRRCGALREGAAASQEAGKGLGRSGLMAHFFYFVFVSADGHARRQQLKSSWR